MFELVALMRAQCMDKESNSQATPVLYPGWAILGSFWPQWPVLSLARPVRLPSDEQKTPASTGDISQNC